MKSDVCSSCRNCDATKKFKMSWFYQPPTDFKSHFGEVDALKTLELVLCENCFETAKTINDFQTVGDNQDILINQANLKIYEVRRSRAEIEYSDYIQWHSGQYP